MDLSKLPKFSQTPPPPPPDAPGATPFVVPEPDEDDDRSPTVELFCQCGAPIVAGTNFCAHCGASYRDVLRGPGAGPAGPPTGPGPMWVEAFLSIAVGLFLLVMAPTGFQY